MDREYLVAKHKAEASMMWRVGGQSNLSGMPQFAAGIARGRPRARQAGSGLVRMRRWESGMGLRHGRAIGMTAALRDRAMSDAREVGGCAGKRCGWDSEE